MLFCWKGPIYGHSHNKYNLKWLSFKFSFSAVHHLYGQLSTAYTYIVHTHKNMLKELPRLSAQSLENIRFEVTTAMLIWSLIHMHYVIIFNYTITQHLFHRTSASLQAMNVWCSLSDQYDDQYFLLPSLFSVWPKALLTSYNSNLISE